MTWCADNDEWGLGLQADNDAEEVLHQRQVSCNAWRQLSAFDVQIQLMSKDCFKVMPGHPSLPLICWLQPSHHQTKLLSQALALWIILLGCVRQPEVVCHSYAEQQASVHSFGIIHVRIACSVVAQAEGQKFEDTLQVSLADCAWSQVLLHKTLHRQQFWRQYKPSRCYPSCCNWWCCGA